MKIIINVLLFCTVLFITACPSPLPDRYVSVQKTYTSTGGGNLIDAPTHDYTFTIDIQDDGSIISFDNVKLLGLYHPYVSFLSATIMNPQGKSLYIFDNTNFLPTSLELHHDYTFTDSSTDFYQQEAAPSVVIAAIPYKVPQIFKLDGTPNTESGNPGLNSFANENIKGSWKLILHNTQEAIGTYGSPRISNWSIDLTYNKKISGG